MKNDPLYLPERRYEFYTYKGDTDPDDAANKIERLSYYVQTALKDGTPSVIVDAKTGKEINMNEAKAILNKMGWNLA